MSLTRKKLENIYTYGHLVTKWGWIPEKNQVPEVGASTQLPPLKQQIVLQNHQLWPFQKIFVTSHTCVLVTYNWVNKADYQENMPKIVISSRSCNVKVGCWPSDIAQCVLTWSGNDIKTVWTGCKVLNLGTTNSSLAACCTLPCCCSVDNSLCWHENGLCVHAHSILTRARGDIKLHIQIK